MSFYNICIQLCAFKHGLLGVSSDFYAQVLCMKKHGLTYSHNTEKIQESNFTLINNYVLACHFICFSICLDTLLIFVIIEELLLKSIRIIIITKFIPGLLYYIAILL